MDQHFKELFMKALIFVLLFAPLLMMGQNRFDKEFQKADSAFKKEMAGFHKPDSLWSQIYVNHGYSYVGQADTFKVSALCSINHYYSTDSNNRIFSPIFVVNMLCVEQPNYSIKYLTIDKQPLPDSIYVWMAHSIK
jgi:hypothetical protein